jgi:hypothetical protein
MKLAIWSVVFCGLFSISVLCQSTEKVDEFENITCDDYLARMDHAIYVASENPASTIYFLIYEGKEPQWSAQKKKSEFLYPHWDSANAKIRSMKKYIATRRASINRFKFVKAGFRKRLTVEIWLVPVGASIPAPTPTLTKMKYRKGKATGFCIWCCGF